MESAALTTPEQINRFRLAVIERGLRLEVETGMKMCRVSVSAAARDVLARAGRFAPRAKRSLLRALTEYLAALPT